MAFRDVVSLMLNNGYQIMSSNVKCLTFMINVDEENDFTRVVGLVDNLGKIILDSEQLENIKNQIERKFLLSRTRNFQMLYLIFSDNFERDKSYSQGDFNFWLIDELAYRVIVFENQPEEFCGLRNKIDEIYEKEYIEAQGNRDNSSDKYDNNGRIKGMNKNKNILKRNLAHNNFIPVVTLIIILINCLVFLGLEIKGDTLNPQYMLDMGASYWQYIFENKEYYRLFTAMFLHFGFAHLANNMVALWILGMESEKFYGKIQYILIYIIGGLAGSISSAIYYQVQNENTVSAGASGAIYAVLGSIVIMTLLDKKKKVRGNYIRIILVFMLMFFGSGTYGNVDNVAHLGGFFGGIAISFILYKIKILKHK